MLTACCQSIDCTNPADAETYSLESGLVFTSGVLTGVAQCPVGFECLPGTAPHSFTYPRGRWTVPVPGPFRFGGGILILKGCQSDIVREITPGMTNDQIAAIATEMFVEAAQQQAECDMETQPGVTRNRPSNNPPPETFELSAFGPNTACINEAYSGSIFATMPVIFSVIGTLPAGLSLAPLGTPATTAVLSGTPTEFGSTTFVIKAEFSHTTLGTVTAYRQVNFSVGGISTASPLPDGVVNVAYSETLSVVAMPGTLVWSVSAGTLPPGITLNASTGELSGSPTSAGVFTFTIAASN